MLLCLPVLEVYIVNDGIDGLKDSFDVVMKTRPMLFFPPALRILDYETCDILTFTQLYAVVKLCRLYSEGLKNCSLIFTPE